MFRRKQQSCGKGRIPSSCFVQTLLKKEIVSEMQQQLLQSGCCRRIVNHAASLFRTRAHDVTTQIPLLPLPRAPENWLLYRVHIMYARVCRDPERRRVGERHGGSTGSSVSAWSRPTHSPGPAGEPPRSVQAGSAGIHCSVGRRDFANFRKR